MYSTISKLNCRHHFGVCKRRQLSVILPSDTMPGSKFKSVLCLIIILNAFGAYSNPLGVVSNTLRAVSSVVKNCTAPTEPASPFPKGMAPLDLLPNREDLWKSLKDTLELSLRGPDLRTVPQMIRDDGYTVESHTITTDDGYILTYFRIPYGKNNSNSGLPRPPVFVQHGLFTHAGNWIAVAEKDCLPYILADAGYDVWLGNARGTLPSQGHTNPDISDADYWDFSWEEMGIHDIPAAVSYILTNTSYPQLYYIGHSMGTSMMYAGLSLKPEVSDKIKVMFTLAPVAYMYRSFTALRLIAPAELAYEAIPSGVSDRIPGQLNQDELNRLLQAGFQILCDPSIASSVVCGNFAFLLNGYDYEQTNFTAFAKYMGHFTNPMSLKSIRHYGQSMLRNHFRRFDYGPIRNYAKYNQCTPPEFDVSRIRCKTFFFYGENDAFSQKEDVLELAGRFNQSILQLHRIPSTHWNHVDHMVAKNTRQFIADPIISYMKQYPI